MKIKLTDTQAKLLAQALEEHARANTHYAMHCATESMVNECIRKVDALSVVREQIYAKQVKAMLKKEKKHDNK